jgi:hypothetical protein
MNAPMIGKELDLIMGQMLAWAATVYGKRSSAVRSRWTRKQCSVCKAPLPPPHTPGSRYCILCSAATIHSVYVVFRHSNGWECRFLEWDLKTPVSKQITFRNSGKIYEMARRGNTLNLDSNRLALDHAVEIGHGAFWLHLTVKQYQVLKSRCTAEDPKSGPVCSSDNFR